MRASYAPVVKRRGSVEDGWTERARGGTDVNDEPERVIEPLMAETMRTISEMSRTNDLEQRRLQSEIVRNLCESLGVFLELMEDFIDPDEFEEFIEDDEDLED
jgi:hypothetical protein